jgi:hypothetical protein
MNDQRFRLEDYIPVQERINRFWEDHPDGRIVTQLASDPGDFEICRYRAEVYRSLDDERPAAIGHAFERAGQGMANQTSHEENCETSAIGRALANLGYATSHLQRPSREEMQKVERTGGDHDRRGDAGPRVDQNGLASLLSRANGRGLTADDLEAIAARNYGVTSSREMTVEQGRHLYRWLTSCEEADLADEVMRAVVELASDTKAGK